MSLAVGTTFDPMVREFGHFGAHCLAEHEVVSATCPNTPQEGLGDLALRRESVASGAVRKSLRCTIEPDLASLRSNRLSGMTATPLCGVFKVGHSIVGFVFGARTLRVFGLTNDVVNVIGKPIRIGHIITSAGLFVSGQRDWQMIGRLEDNRRPILVDADVMKRVAA